MKAQKQGLNLQCVEAGGVFVTGTDPGNDANTAGFLHTLSFAKTPQNPPLKRFLNIRSRSVSFLMNAKALHLMDVRLLCL